MELGDLAGERWETLEALVDTGSSYSVAPASLLRRLGVSPRARREFRLAGERIVERDIGLAQVRIDGHSLPTIVVFEEEGVKPLVGAYTLEGLGLAPDLVGQRLIPVPGLLKQQMEALSRLSLEGGIFWAGRRAMDHRARVCCREDSH